MPNKIPIECPTCKSNITKTQFSIGCASCGIYFHPECAGISEDSLTSMRKNSIKFVCVDCKNGDAHGCENRDILKRMEEMHKSIESRIEMSRVDIEHRMESCYLKIEAKVNQLMDNFRGEINNKMAAVSSEVKKCLASVHEQKTLNNDNYRYLQMRNNMLERRMNRADILISGLTCPNKDVRQNVIKIASCVGVRISESDILHCCYISRQKRHLVKFNSVQVRDLIMKSYFKSKSLLLNDVIAGAPESRLFLNDNLSPAGNKLQYTCRKLMLAKKIKKFTLVNMDNPKAKVVLHDEKTVLWDLNQCENMLDGEEVDVGSQQTLT